MYCVNVVTLKISGNAFSPKIKLLRQWVFDVPAASVSGFYLSHPQSSYFNVGPIGADQVQDYAMRSGRDEKELRRALAQSL